MAHLAHYKEAHPLPMVIWHWVNLVSMFTLIFTGFYIHYPFFPGAMGVCRGVHVLAGIILLLALLYRIILAFTVKSAPTGGTRDLVRDWKTYAPQKSNRHGLVQCVKYYLFIKKEHPLQAKLGVLQKISYLCFVPLFLIMGWTGFALWIPTSEWAIFACLVNWFGVMNVRLIHWFVMFVIILIICIHVYLATIEGLAGAKLILFRQEHGGLVYDPVTRDIIGYDAMGHGQSFGAEPTHRDLDKEHVKS